LLGLKNYVVVPFIIKDQPLGALLADRQTSQVPITEEEIPILQMFANQAGLAIENAKLYKQIEDLAITDGLTNLFNHRYFQDCLKLEVQRMSRYENRHDICLSLLMIDVDHFKQYNDTYGHQAGDRVLNEMGQLLKNSLRKVDVVARYGGEEFVIVLPMTTKEQAVMLAERLRASVEKYPFETADKTSLGPVTISLGVATYREDGMNEQDLIGIADQCLYAAKQAGRNCVRHRPIEKEQPVQ
jgi:diguanylate cyclase (GGDEF)-like protein